MVRPLGNVKVKGREQPVTIYHGGIMVWTSCRCSGPPGTLKIPFPEYIQDTGYTDYCSPE